MATHTTDFDPQAEADFARIEADAAAAARAERGPLLVTAQISRYLGEDDVFMVIITHRLPDGDYKTHTAASNATMADALYALAKVVTNG